jgi:hypothetical protein
LTSGVNDASDKWKKFETGSFILFCLNAIVLLFIVYSDNDFATVSYPVSLTPAKHFVYIADKLPPVS